MSKSRKTLSLTLNTHPTEVGLKVTLLMRSGLYVRSETTACQLSSISFETKRVEYSDQRQLKSERNTCIKASC